LEVKIAKPPYQPCTGGAPFLIRILQIKACRYLVVVHFGSSFVPSLLDGSLRLHILSFCGITPIFGIVKMITSIGSEKKGYSQANGFERFIYVKKLMNSNVLGVIVKPV